MYPHINREEMQPAVAYDGTSDGFLSPAQIEMHRPMDPCIIASKSGQNDEGVGDWTMQRRAAFGNTEGYFNFTSSGGKD